MSQDSLTDKVVILTGASSGIGWATALELAPFRPRLALLARRAAKLEELARAMPGVEVLALPCDVSDVAQARAAVRKATERWGRVDVLINNAGVAAHARFHEQAFESVEEMMRINYLGAANLIHACLPGMLRQGRGHVVNVASIAGIMGLPYMAAYCASKFALVGLTEALRREHYGTGVTFTALCPGTVDTPMAEASLRDERVSRAVRPKTAAQVARKIVQSCLTPAPEVIYGEAPGFLLRLTHLAPRAADWLTHRVWSWVHPMAREDARKR